MSVETVTPTEAERNQAGKIRDAMFDAIKAAEGPTARDVIAQALAEQRAEIVGRYEAVADELASWPAARIMSPHDAAERIRSVAR